MILHGIFSRGGKEDADGTDMAFRYQSVEPSYGASCRTVHSLNTCGACRAIIALGVCPLSAIRKRADIRVDEAK